MKKKYLTIVLCLLMALSLSGCGKNDKKNAPEAVNITKMQAICELATLECYYHNTAKLSKEKDVLWWDTKAQLWVEYSGIVKMGVDIGSLEMKVDGENVKITMPKAVVLSCEVDQSSFDEENYLVNRDGLGAEKITADDQTLAFQMAQEKMKETAENDTALIAQATERARELMENYINSVGDAAGIKYKIEWITDNSSTEQGPVEEE